MLVFAVCYHKSGLTNEAPIKLFKEKKVGAETFSTS